MEDTKDSKYQVAFDIIMKAGDARSIAMMAIDKAKEFDFIEARKCLEQAEKRLLEAHECQTEMIQQEAQGNEVDINIILVHAEDHFSMASTAIDFAEQFINLYELIYKLK
jgi:PTS system cellobiose-specific IIA component